MDLQPSSVQKPGSLFSLHLSFIKRELTYALSFFIVLLSSIALLGYLGPFHPQSLIPSSLFTQNNNGLGKSEPKPAVSCDYSSGRWVWDEGFARSYGESCQFLDPGFQCHRNGRKDVDYLKWRWQPDGCDLLRFGHFSQ